MRSYNSINRFLWFFLCVFSLKVQAQTTPPPPLPPFDSLDLNSLRQIADELLAQARLLENEWMERERDADFAAASAMASLEQAKVDSGSTKIQLDSLAKSSKTARDLYKKNTQLREKAGKVAQFLNGFTEMDSVAVRKNLPKAWKQVLQLHHETYPPAPEAKPLEKNEMVAETPEKKSKPAKKEPAPPGPVIKKYDPATDVMLRPPTPPCIIAASSRDEFSGEISREMARVELFRYTNPALKNYLQGKTHVVCEVALAAAGPRATLLLTFTINDPNARKAFGRLEKNSIAQMKFMDGSSITLQNAVADDGQFQPESGATIYRAQYALMAETLRKMRRTELDKLRIAWSNGYEDYDVQYVDLLMRQAECLWGGK
jgi:hypothetical protein